MFYPSIFKQYINEDTIKAYFISSINEKFEKNSELFSNFNCFIIFLEFAFRQFLS